MQYIVTNLYDGLNLRAAPSTSSTLLGTMPFATLCDLRTDTGTKWKEIRTTLNGQTVTGFASDVYLTVVKSDAVVRLLQSAFRYWTLFDRGAGKEDVEPFKAKVLNMWDALGGGRPPGDDTSDKDWPWSAAGMSAFVRDAGGYAGFRFAAGHSVYIHDSIVKMSGGAAAPFWGYRITERKPEPGDLVAQWRKTRRTYDFAANHNDFTSHTDLVCQVRDGAVRTLGANVSNSVSVKTYSLTPDGFLKGENNEIALMKNCAV